MDPDSINILPHLPDAWAYMIILWEGQFPPMFRHKTQPLKNEPAVFITLRCIKQLLYGVRIYCDLARNVAVPKMLWHVNVCSANTPKHPGDWKDVTSTVTWTSWRYANQHCMIYSTKTKTFIRASSNIHVPHFSHDRCHCSDLFQFGSKPHWE